MLGRIARSQRGAFMVFFAILVPFFLGMIGFAVDAGFVYMQKAKMQDIADAAALAGAARLNDSEDREGHVTSAVKAYTEANGMKTNATNLFRLDDEASLKPSKNNFQIAHGILTSVMDKDNVQRDHVRVVIAKRVPTFFIGILLPEEKEGVLVKAAAEAEYVEGEAPVVTGDDAVIYGGQINQLYKTKDNIKLGTNNYFPVYASADDIDPYKLPGTGYVYANQLNNTGRHYDQDKKTIVWEPPLPAGREFVYTINQQYYGPFEEAEKLAAAEWAEAQRMKKRYDELKEKAKTEATVIGKEREKYILGEGNKRFIGKNDAGELIDNIKETDTEIDLYMEGTYDKDESWVADYNCWLTNRQLKNVKKINNLLLAKNWSVIATSEIEFGNVYDLNGKGIAIDGQNNIFSGMVYTGGQMTIGGDNNTFSPRKNTSVICETTIHLGLSKHITERYDNGWLRMSCSSDIYESNNDNWRVNFGTISSSSGSGSSGSDSGTSAHVRLVK